MGEPFFTVGHSTRPIEEFIALLRPNAVGRVIDVRTIPRSRTNPQYNIDALPGSLAREGIEYEHILSLGGRKGRSRTVPPELNAYWENQAFHNYADYALGPEFRAGFERLLALGRAERCAIMCAEAVWWRCHRRIVTDYLLAAGESVFHLVASDVPEPATITPEARPWKEGLVYPARQAGLAF